MNTRTLQTTTVASKRASSSLRYEGIIDSYLNRAQEFVYRQDYSRAIYELREALKTYPRSVKCHSKLSNLYYQSAQYKMAEIHARKTLELDPKNQEAIRVQQLLAKQRVANNNKQRITNNKRKVNVSAQKQTGLLGFFTKKVF